MSIVQCVSLTRPSDFKMIRANKRQKTTTNGAATLLPVDIVHHILSFAPDHRDQFRKVMEELKNRDEPTGFYCHGQDMDGVPCAEVLPDLQRASGVLQSVLRRRLALIFLPQTRDGLPISRWIKYFCDVCRNGCDCIWDHFDGCGCYPSESLTDVHMPWDGKRPNWTGESLVDQVPWITRVHGRHVWS